jgi:hypothetical protein
LGAGIDTDDKTHRGLSVTKKVLALPKKLNETRQAGKETMHARGLLIGVEHVMPRCGTICAQTLCLAVARVFASQQIRVLRDARTKRSAFHCGKRK